MRWWNRQRVPILCYHSVVDAPLHPLVQRGGLHLQLALFRKQIEFIARHYNVMPLEDVARALTGGSDSLPRRSIVLTFDDGYANNLSHAVPILQQFGLPATIFLATDYIGRERFYWWDELALLLANGAGRQVAAQGWGMLDLTTTAGVEHAFARGQDLLAAADLEQRRRHLSALADAAGPIETNEQTARLRPATWQECRQAPALVHFSAHGAAHRRLDRLPLEAAHAEIRSCRDALREQLGDAKRTVFCYPQGGMTQEVRSCLPGLGFNAAVCCTDSPGDEALVQYQTESTQLPRIGVSAEMAVPTLAGNAAGFRILLRRMFNR
jgi:peptidoglycan/xylan/chitin deacetylase (PgdA/CDA1 family)